MHTHYLRKFFVLILPLFIAARRDPISMYNVNVIGHVFSGALQLFSYHTAQPIQLPISSENASCPKLFDVHWQQLLAKQFTQWSWRQSTQPLAITLSTASLLCNTCQPNIWFSNTSHISIPSYSCHWKIRNKSPTSFLC